MNALQLIHVNKELTKKVGDIQWVCPNCSEPVLRYVGERENGPAPGDKITKEDWEYLRGDRDLTAGDAPKCKCGSALYAAARYLIKNNERATKHTQQN